MIRLFGGWLMLAGIGVLKRKEVEANKIDKQGAHSPKSAPTRQQLANGNKQPHGTMSVGCGRLFRLGFVGASSVGTRQIVSWPGPGCSLVLGRFPSARSRESAPLGFGFDFRAAKTEDFACILH